TKQVLVLTILFFGIFCFVVYSVVSLPGGRYTPPTNAIYSPDPSQLAILSQGVEEWNRWRKAYPEITPHLSGADLSYRDLDRVDLSGADLRCANLYTSSLKQADLRNAQLD